MYYLHDQSPFLLWKKNAFFQWRVSRARTLKGTQVYILFFYTKTTFFFVNKLRLTKYNYKNIIRIFLGRESQL